MDEYAWARRMAVGFGVALLLIGLYLLWGVELQFLVPTVFAAWLGISLLFLVGGLGLLWFAFFVTPPRVRA